MGNVGGRSLKRKKNGRDKIGDVSGSAVLIWVICLQNESNSVIGVQWCYSKHGAYITHNATQPLSDITRGSLSNHMQLVERQKTLNYFFHTCSSAARDL